MWARRAALVCSAWGYRKNERRQYNLNFGWINFHGSAYKWHYLFQLLVHFATRPEKMWNLGNSFVGKFGILREILLFQEMGGGEIRPTFGKFGFASWEIYFPVHLVTRDGGNVREERKEGRVEKREDGKMDHDNWLGLCEMRRGLVQPIKVFMLKSYDFFLIRFEHYLPIGWEEDFYQISAN